MAWPAVSGLRPDGSRVSARQNLTACCFANRRGGHGDLTGGPVFDRYLTGLLAAGSPAIPGVLRF
ncbi:hypothetical protein [Dialister invisus]|uniref:hypothetical protein n=1 Tax=Dialister invisus TaxID=218538 RepID=UPI0026748C41|nr:hypothetical protein [Dialister invisus]